MRGKEGRNDMASILIIEDEISIAELERDYLELSGFEVEIEHLVLVDLNVHSKKILI